jgi:hypothetical protein
MPPREVVFRIGSEFLGSSFCPWDYLSRPESRGKKPFGGWLGPQRVGFSLAHIHPLFFVTGAHSASLIIGWLVPAGIYAIVRRKNVSGLDLGMILVALLVAVAIIVPNNFFAGLQR